MRRPAHLLSNTVERRPPAASRSPPPAARPPGARTADVGEGRLERRMSWAQLRNSTHRTRGLHAPAQTRWCAAGAPATQAPAENPLPLGWAM
ncbi:hypothetical protein QJS66_00885 [Kocuria rhizophila]|nr:hypothetical protein QJS66_00885 [Kocuria rhizophila]